MWHPGEDGRIEVSGVWHDVLPVTGQGPEYFLVGALGVDFSPPMPLAIDDSNEVRLPPPEKD